MIGPALALDLKTVSDRHWSILRDVKRTWRFQVTAAALEHVASGDYAGEHWLASFAVYLLTTKPGD